MRSCPDTDVDPAILRKKVVDVRLQARGLIAYKFLLSVLRYQSSLSR